MPKKNKTNRTRKNTPKGTKKKKADISKRINNILEDYSDFIKNNSRSTLYAIKTGQGLNLLRKKIEENWETFIDNNLKHIGIRQCQRFSSLARCVDIEKHPVLLNLPRTKLYTLNTLSEKEDIGTYLEENNFDLDFEDDDKESIKQFQTEVNDHIKECKTKKASPSKNKSESKKTDEKKSTPKNKKFKKIKLFYRWLNKDLKKYQTSTKKISKKKHEYLTNISDLLIDYLNENKHK